MYGVIKAVIESKKYELRDMLKKLDTFWVQGSITEEERAELIALAQGNAQTSNSVDMLAKMEEIDRRVKALETALASQNRTEESEDGEEPVEVTYPEYEVGKWYYAGDIVAFEGVNYICIAPTGAVCTWSPSEYPTYWKVYEEPVEEVVEDEAVEPEETTE